MSSTSTLLEEEWGAFSKRVEGLIQSVVGLCSLFLARGVPCSLKTLE
jgi:hypothetical protein